MESDTEMSAFIKGNKIAIKYIRDCLFTQHGMQNLNSIKDWKEKVKEYMRTGSGPGVKILNLSDFDQTKKKFTRSRYLMNFETKEEWIKYNFSSYKDY